MARQVDYDFATLEVETNEGNSPAELVGLILLVLGSDKYRVFLKSDEAHPLDPKLIILFPDELEIEFTFVHESSEELLKFDPILLSTHSATSVDSLRYLIGAAVVERLVISYQGKPVHKLDRLNMPKGLLLVDFRFINTLGSINSKGLPPSSPPSDSDSEEEGEDDDDILRASREAEAARRFNAGRSDIGASSSSRPPSSSGASSSRPPRPPSITGASSSATLQPLNAELHADLPINAELPLVGNAAVLPLNEAVVDPFLEAVEALVAAGAGRTRVNVKTKEEEIEWLVRGIVANYYRRQPWNETYKMFQDEFPTRYAGNERLSNLWGSLSGKKNKGIGKKRKYNSPDLQGIIDGLVVATDKFDSLTKNAKADESKRKYKVVKEGLTEKRLKEIWDEQLDLASQSNSQLKNFVVAERVRERIRDGRIPLPVIPEGTSSLVLPHPGKRSKPAAAKSTYHACPPAKRMKYDPSFIPAVSKKRKRSRTHKSRNKSAAPQELMLDLQLAPPSAPSAAARGPGPVPSQSDLVLAIPSVPAQGPGPVPPESDLRLDLQLAPPATSVAAQGSGPDLQVAPPSAPSVAAQGSGPDLQVAPPSAPSVAAQGSGSASPHQSVDQNDPPQG